MNGGFFVSLVEMAMSSSLGCNISLPNQLRKDAFLFGESQGRILVTVAKAEIDVFKNEMKSYDIPFLSMGIVESNPEIIIDSLSFGTVENFIKISENVINP